MRVEQSEQGRPKVARRYGGVVCRENPWIVQGRVEGQIVGTRKRKHSASEDLMVFSKGSGEVLEGGAAGFWTTEIVDSTQFVKLFVAGVRALRALSSAGAKVFEILYREVQKNKDQEKVFLNFEFVDQAITPISEAVYYRGLNNLVEKEFIAPSPATNLFWINPSYLWNGDRLVFAQDYILEGSREAEKHRARLLTQGQKALPFGEAGEVV